MTGQRQTAPRSGPILVVAATLASLSLFAPPAWAQSAPIIYPSAGQSLEQQASDEAACRTWGQQQTGVYPGQSAPSYSSSTSQQAGAPVLGGAARGAALGAVGGAIAGDAGKGAAIGAGVGATAGLMRRGQQRRQQASANDQAQAQYQADLGRFNQAFSACMQGRKYTVR
ncbi:MAG: hypothetical protein GEU87_01255 [Alphaproteobacteria bacterium]|nr:hypothetical protein [Alphaproteobacteria bacterium]